MVTYTPKLIGNGRCVKGVYLGYFHILFLFDTQSRCTKYIMFKFCLQAVSFRCSFFSIKLENLVFIYRYQYFNIIEIICLIQNVLTESIPGIEYSNAIVWSIGKIFVWNTNLKKWILATTMYGMLAFNEIFHFHIYHISYKQLEFYSIFIIPIHRMIFLGKLIFKWSDVCKHSYKLQIYSLLFSFLSNWHFAISYLMYKHILTSIFWCNEAPSFGNIEPFARAPSKFCKKTNCAKCYFQSFIWYQKMIPIQINSNKMDNYHSGKMLHYSYCSWFPFQFFFWKDVKKCDVVFSCYCLLDVVWRVSHNRFKLFFDSKG